jgi:hypothetical protein
MAAMLGRAIQRATWDRYRIPRLLTPVLKGVQYPAAVVQSAYMATAFRRIYDDDADYAHYQADLALTWVIANDQLP